MKKLILLALLTASPLAQALTDSEEALARIREQTKNQYIYVDEQTKNYIEAQELRDELERVSKLTGIPVEKFTSKPEETAEPVDRFAGLAKSAPATAEMLRGIDLAKLEQERDYGIRWVNVGIAALLSAAALFACGVGLKATIQYLRSNSGVRERVIENSQRLAALVVVCAVVGSFAISSTYEIADTDVPKWAVMAAVWLTLIGAVYGVARLSRPAQPQQ